jgi:hypothetical protein
MLVDGGGHSRWMQHLAPDDQVCEDVHVDAELAVLRNGKAIAEEVQNQSVTIQGT